MKCIKYECALKWNVLYCSAIYREFSYETWLPLFQYSSCDCARVRTVKEIDHVLMFITSLLSYSLTSILPAAFVYLFDEVVRSLWNTF